ncbi:uncharacterized protein IL334_004565 [Kwoniella shivajii]|uniref:C2H2-type domain-containing protein n=1 Tax=Kwoniella shivajii TaxID=564305 RepID=A0ABZ1D0U9_9TREE|nr:hypothetical protein IL334_004565 [Kwoniella shivajii]
MAPQPPNWSVLPYPYEEHVHGMTYHPPPLHPPPTQQNSWVNYYPPRPLLEHIEEDDTTDSYHDLPQDCEIEGEDELEFDPIIDCRPNRRNKKIPSGQGPTARSSTSVKSKGKAKTKATSRSRATSIINPDTFPIDDTPGDVDVTSTMTAIFLPDPSQPPIQLRGMSKNGLLPAPEGCILDVNDLLILHPSKKEHQGLKGHTSQYEMYTCRVCSKTYDGKNARSVARRHLQDKHGVPLSVQKRRSRWDYEPDRPKSEKDAKERSLKSKRDWVNRHRQIQKLEKNHEPFLERFGPNGIIAPCGTKLVAPMFRGEVEAPTKGKNKRYLDGTNGNLIIPESILRGLDSIMDSKSTLRSSGDMDTQDPPDEQQEVSVKTIQSKVKARKGQGKKTSAKGREPLTLLDAQESLASRTETPLRALSSISNSPDQQYPMQYQDSATPITSFRGLPSHPPHIYALQNSQPLQPASMAFYNGQYHFTFQPTFSHDVQQFQSYGEPDEMESSQILPKEEESVPSSPEEMAPMPEQQWVASDSWTQLQVECHPVDQALDITQQWQGLQPSNWSQEEAGGSVNGDLKDGSTETEGEGEAVAAESLLNLHSTPSRGPDDTGRNDVQLDRAQVQFNRLPKAVEDVNTVPGVDAGDPAWSSQLLSAPTIKSPTRPRAGRSSSFIQPFRDPRPEVTRSLSFDARPNLEDPFVLPESPTRPSSVNGSNRLTPLASIRRAKRHTISLPSPSPLTTSLKKRKEAPTSPVNRRALKPVSTNFTFNFRPNYSGSFATPIKPSSANSISNSTFPQSVTKEWLQFSSPNNADAAMSLGLVPTHLAPATPGLTGIVGAETPEMTILEARAKKRRSEAGTPGLGIGSGLRRRS